MSTPKVGLLFNNSRNIVLRESSIDQMLERDSEAFDYLSVVLQSADTVTAMDIAPFELARDIDDLFDTLNSKQSTTYGDSLDLIRFQCDSIKEVLTSVIANLEKVVAVDSSKLDQEVQNAITVSTNAANLIQQYSTSNSKYLNMLNTLKGRLRKLEEFNRSITLLETNLLSLGEFAAVDSSFLNLKVGLEATHADTLRTVARAQANLDAICFRSQALNKLIHTNTELTERLQNLELKAKDLGATFASAVRNAETMDGLLAKAKDKCAIIDEFLRCLIIYHAQMVRAGSNTGMSKENKVFRIEGLLPAEPPCDEVVYAEPTTTVPPRTTTPVPDPGCAPPTVVHSLSQTGSNFWPFEHNTAYSRPTGVTSTSDIKVTNPNNFSITVTLRFVVFCFSDDALALRVVLSQSALQAISATSSNVDVPAPTIEADSVRINPKATGNMQEQVVKVEYRLTVPAKGVAEVQLFGSFPGSNNSGVDVFRIEGAYLKAERADGRACGNEKTILMPPTTTTPVPKNPKDIWYPCSNTKVKTSHMGEFYQERAVTMGRTFIPKNKPMFDANKYTTDMTYLKFVLARFTYNIKTRKVFHCYCYTNSDMDGPYGISFWDNNIESCTQWVGYHDNYRYVETEDWRVMAEIYHNDDFYLR